MPEPLLGDSRARQALDDLHARPVSFQVADRELLTPATGWRLDAYRQTLPGEPPGPPVPGGTWELARDLMQRYEFADPAIVRAIYHPDDPLAGRDMLLELRFHGLRFHVGVRVGGVRDEVCESEGRPVRLWGWNYRTLQGHLELGQMDYELWKWLDTGEVEFRIHVVSRPGRIGNPLLRLGFRLFGRREQVRFAHSACERMLRLTEAKLAGRAAPEDLARAADEIVVQPASEAGRPGPTAS